MFGSATLPNTLAQAESANAPSLVISHLKITSSNGQFVVLYNTTDVAIDASKYQLEYFNSYDIGKATTSKLVALEGIVPPHGHFMVSDGSTVLCFQMTVDAATLGFASTAGLVELLKFNQSLPGAMVSSTVQDFVGWSKTTVVGAQALPTNTAAFLLRQPLDSQNHPTVAMPGDGNWQQVQADVNSNCSYQAVSTGNPVTVFADLLPASQPPLAQSDVVAAETYSTVNAGLMMPVLTELLPNPNGTGNDATNEYVELYNPNAVVFDMSGYSLRSGTTAQHTYTFPHDSSLAPQSFSAFYSSTTSLSLSNSSGQVSLLDPAGKALDSSAVYGIAKDGYVWALDNASWYWSTTATPNNPNKMSKPVAAAKSPKALSGSVTSKSTTTQKTANSSVLGAQSSSKTSAPTTPIHLWTLALVAGLALLYGAYEFRTDLANRFHQFREYASNRFRNRIQIKGWRSYRIGK